MKKIVLAYSGGLDTSVILHWLKATYKVPIVAFIADVGQNEDLKAAEAKALATGADTVRVRDLKDEFAKDYIFPAVQAAAVYEAGYLLGTSLARPVIAKHMIQTALEEGADAVSHGATGKGNDQVRFELAVKALAPQLSIVAPWRTWSFTGRKDLIAYAQKNGIPVPVTTEKPYSSDANLMHISYEGGILEDPWAAPPENMFQLTTSPEQAPAQSETVMIDFVDGTPAGINGEKLGPAKLVTALNALAGKHGVGRIDLVENRFVGMKSRGVYETPGCTVLHSALRALESITMDREVLRVRNALSLTFAEKAYYGFWFSPEMQVLRSTVASALKGVTGTVRVKLYKGNATVTGRKSPQSLYNPEIASFETHAQYNPADATGFINLQGLRLALNKSLRHA